MTPLIWFGPVFSGQVRGSVPPGHRLHVVNCVGDIAPDRNGDGRPDFDRCSTTADRWRDVDGRRLPALRKRLGLDVAARPVLAAFSAGGQCVRRLLLDPRDRAEIAGVYLADATYGMWAQKGIVAVDELQEALVAMAVECAANSRPFVATASAHVPGGGGPTASVTLATLQAEMQTAGLCFGGVLASPVLEGLAPLSAERSGSVLLVDFGRETSHAGHATKIAPVLLPRILAA
jgi:hypothetical protein